MDNVIKNAFVENAGCNGCIRHKRDVMVTFTTDPEPGSDKKVEFNDFFLTTAQAEELLERLKKVLVQNMANATSVEP